MTPRNISELQIMFMATQPSCVWQNSCHVSARKIWHPHQNTWSRISLKAQHQTLTPIIISPSWSRDQAFQVVTFEMIEKLEWLQSQHTGWGKAGMKSSIIEVALLSPVTQCHNPTRYFRVSRTGFSRRSVLSSPLITFLG